VVITVKPLAVRRVDFDNLINHFYRFSYQRIVRRFDSKPYELQETGVNDLSFIEKSGAVVEFNLFSLVRVAVLRDAQ
jgi:hypothetical protein